MNRIANISPILIISAPVALFLLLLGIDRLAARGKGPWVKLALAVNTCILLLTGSVLTAPARAEEDIAVDCYEIDIVPDEIDFWRTGDHPSFKELVQLDVKLNNAISSGIYSDGLYKEIKEKVETQIEILLKDKVITGEQAGQIRDYFETRLEIYALETGKITCYYFGF